MLLEFVSGYNLRLCERRGTPSPSETLVTIRCLQRGGLVRLSHASVSVVVAWVLLVPLDRTSAASTQIQAQSGAEPQTGDQAGTDAGIALPDSLKLRFTVDFLAGYGSDGANTMLGFNRQGRVGYVIFAVHGEAGTRLSYLISVNPVNETEPLPACGIEGFFYPNDPKRLYGEDTTLRCQPKNGNRRVDAYRGIALDVAPQQGPIREAYIDVRVMNQMKLRFGRTKLPIGFDWQDAGSFSAKDAPRIQRINAEHSFGAMLSYARPAEGKVRPLFSGNAAAYLGEGNRWWDYNYFYFEDGSLDSNRDLTMLLSGTLSPTNALEVRAAYQKGKTGSKVESRPSYWASKRNDDALVLSASYQLNSSIRLIAEHANYTWGPTKTSARMLEADYSSIHKRGFYIAAEAHHRITQGLSIGGSVSREEIARADSLIKFMAVRHQYQVSTGRKDRMLTLRAYADVGRQLQIGLYNTRDFNPFPWLSGVSPVTGPGAFAKRSTDKWGLITRLRVM
jgi:hypothetical protein